jgi:hypothetical protein
VRDYVTQISKEDFTNLFPDGMGADTPILNEFTARIPYPYVIAVHTDNDTYFDKKLGVSGVKRICIWDVKRIRRTRDYFEVFDGNKIYKIKKSETKAIYKVEW